MNYNEISNYYLNRGLFYWENQILNKFGKQQKIDLKKIKHQTKEILLSEIQLLDEFYFAIQLKI
jgi:hypothetical protein